MTLKSSYGKEFGRSSPRKYTFSFTMKGLLGLAALGISLYLNSNPSITAATRTNYTAFRDLGTALERAHAQAVAQTTGDAR